MSENKYIIFRLGNEKYGIDIKNVKEISEFRESNKVPNTPYFIEGIINLRGEIVPIINLKKRFNIDEGETDAETRIIVTNLNDEIVGFIVDEASEVLNIHEDNIEHPSDIIAGIQRQYITGIAKLEEQIIVVLDLVKIVTNE